MRVVVDDPPSGDIASSGDARSPAVTRPVDDVVVANLLRGDVDGTSGTNSRDQGVNDTPRTSASEESSELSPGYMDEGVLAEPRRSPSPEPVANPWYSIRLRCARYSPCGAPNCEHCCPNGTWDDDDGGSCGEHCVENDGAIVFFFPEPLLNCWNKFCEKGGQFAIRRDSELTDEFEPAIFHEYCNKRHLRQLEYDGGVNEDRLTKLRPYLRLYCRECLDIATGYLSVCRVCSTELGDHDLSSYTFCMSCLCFVHGGACTGGADECAVCAAGVQCWRDRSQMIVERNSARQAGKIIFSSALPVPACFAGKKVQLGVNLTMVKNKVMPFGSQCKHE